jgi:hypothetical protein
MPYTNILKEITRLHSLHDRKMLSDLFPADASVLHLVAECRNQAGADKKKLTLTVSGRKFDTALETD